MWGVHAVRFVGVLICSCFVVVVVLCVCVCDEMSLSVGLCKRSGLLGDWKHK